MPREYIFGAPFYTGESLSGGWRLPESLPGGVRRSDALSEGSRRAGFFVEAGVRTTEGVLRASGSTD